MAHTIPVMLIFGIQPAKILLLRSPCNNFVKNVWGNHLLLTNSMCPFDHGVGLSFPSCGELWCNLQWKVPKNTKQSLVHFSFDLDTFSYSMHWVAFLTIHVTHLPFYCHPSNAKTLVYSGFLSNNKRRIRLETCGEVWVLVVNFQSFKYYQF